MKIGIVGKGFVGSAVQNGFSPNTGCDTEVRVYDKNPFRSLHTLEETVNESDVVFISVPTPAGTDGKIDLAILNDAINDINEVSINRKTIFLIRSTVVPGTTDNFQNIFPNLRLVFNPEFLTERSANFDFINQTRFILGGSKDNTTKVADLFRWRFGRSVSILETNYATAELIKYMNNTFFATKVSFMNDMKLLADKCGVVWEDAVEGFIRDGRIGHSHLNVPGHDGRYGFGGSCFPKDIQAIINYADELGVEMDVLKGVWKTNLKVRPERDWEQLKGRAVIDG
jgi:UDPglucose 6-dehydrogenase